MHKEQSPRPGEAKKEGSVDRCICCGEPIPEGRQVCVKCGTMDLEGEKNYD